MLNGMSDPQQPPVPPYASNTGQPSYPPQASPPAQQHYQGQNPQPPLNPAQAYPGPAYSPPAATTSTDANLPGKIGFIIGLISLGLSILSNVIFQIMIRADGYALLNLVSSIFSVIIFLASAAALVFGIIGLRRVGAPHGLAGIATGLGGSVVVGLGFNFILNAVSGIFPY